MISVDVESCDRKHVDERSEAPLESLPCERKHRYASTTTVALIHLPDEVRLARTGVPGVRPMHLPVRRHLIESAAGRVNPADGSSSSLTSLREPESILRENRMLIESEAEEDEAREVIARLRVYEYNQPEVYANCGAPEDTLVFDSLFESGNLMRAERIYRHEDRSMPSTNRTSRFVCSFLSLLSQSHCFVWHAGQEYELMIHPDIKNSAYRQWFYFEVRNGVPGIVYKFSLTNLAKSGALFGNGLQPVVYSEIDADTKGIGWVHRGTHVRYDVSLSPDSPAGTNCLSFQYEFEHEHDCVYFACLRPYTYTDLMEYLEKLERDSKRAAVCRRTELCQSIALNTCDLLTITSSGKDSTPPDEKRVIVLPARVHPGEPNSSWMMKGMIDYLTGPSSGAQILRKHFVFKVVPMLNPDGVINSNTRVNLAGWDLNREWSYPVEKLFPTVYHLKRQIANLQARDRVAIYCDLHGHSLNRNIFTYGCYNKKSSKKAIATASAPLSASMGSSFSNFVSVSPAMYTSSTANLRARLSNDPRVFPMVVAKNSHFFSFPSCDFTVHKSKLNTARVVVNHELGVINSYTLEASFCVPDFGPRKDTQFSTWDLEEMGKSWCQSLLIYFDLVTEVKILDAQGEDSAKQHSKEPSHMQIPQSSGSIKLDNEARLAASIEMSSDLLSDCQVAISELFANPEVDLDDEIDDLVSMDSDLSDAEDEPIPPNSLHGEVGADDPLHGYNSAPENGSQGERRTSEKPRRHSRRQKGSRAARKQSKKGSSKRNKSKKDKGKGSKEKPSPHDDEEVDEDAAACEEAPAAEMQEGSVPLEAASASVKKKPATTKQRKKSKSSKKGRFSKKSASAMSDTEDLSENLLALPLASARTSEVVVLPIMPGSAGRRPSKAGQALVSALGQQHDGIETESRKTRDFGAFYNRGYLCPTPPSSKLGHGKLIRVASPSPVELPLVRPLSLVTGDRGGGGSCKEKLLEACGLVSGKRGGDGRGAEEEDYDARSGSDDDDSDASKQSGPESYLSEF
ncbi:Metalloprotease family m14b, partial [Globisporangium splendens]